ncbi:MAG TPA: zinc-binding alcohol dehydrogenase family protein [Polyangiaceae bacterium]|nr:zinc-binding alcohol dehydrogenase family protein [Polyangiaceae bacterium]
MKALVYRNAHALADFQLELAELPDPELRPGDLLIEVRAISTNPVDTKVRSSRSAAEGAPPVVLGWDAAGVVRAVGPTAVGFSVGDEVYYAGDLLRPGSYAELQAVDHRVVAHKPRSLSFVEAAALPLTSLTAWEGLFERGIGYGRDSVVLVLGGAGGVGSMATQLVRAHTEARVVATASRPETVEWCRSLGANVVVDHRGDLREQLTAAGLGEVDVVFGTTQTDQYLRLLPSLLRPFGHFLLIDDPKSLDVLPLKRKAISTHWEFMFSKLLHDYDVASQGEILTRVAAWIDAGKLRSPLGRTFTGLTADNLRQAHELHETGRAIGKLGITF